MYKVIRDKKGILCSCRVKRRAGVTYIPGKETRAPKTSSERGYHLCVFKTIKLARMFSDNHSDKIWRVKTRGILKQLPQFLSVRNLNYGIIKISRGNWPKGTVMAKVVTLTKEVKK